jgi:hypothetical protein
MTEVDPANTSLKRSCLISLLSLVRLSPGLAAVLDSRASPPEYAGVGGPPCHIDVQEVGPTYLASYI